MEFTNREISEAKMALEKLMDGMQKFPVMLSYGLVKLDNKLQVPFKDIEDVRLNLIKTYGEADPENPQNIRVMEESVNYSKFVEEMGELLSQKVEITFDEVQLPTKITTTCNKCGNNMDKILEIEPGILKALERFMEIY